MPRLGLTTTQRGLGWKHRQERAALLPLAYWTACPLCGRVMLPTEPLDLDHRVPRALGGQTGQGQITHRYCNRSQGEQIRRLRRQALARRWVDDVRSRRW